MEGGRLGAVRWRRKRSVGVARVEEEELDWENLGPTLFVASYEEAVVVARRSSRQAAFPRRKRSLVGGDNRSRPQGTHQWYTINSLIVSIS